MDPDVTWDEMCEHMDNGEWLEARDCALALDTWLKKGGFFPCKMAPICVRSYVNSVLRRTWAYTIDTNSWMADQGMKTCDVAVQAGLLRIACEKFDEANPVCVGEHDQEPAA